MSVSIFVLNCIIIVVLFVNKENSMIIIKIHKIGYYIEIVIAFYMNAWIEIKGDKIFVLQTSKIKPKSLYAFLLIAGIILVAINLRPAITSVGPVVGMIKEDIGLAYWSVSLLTSLPLIAFAVVSPITPKIANKLSNERTLLWGLVCILAGIIIRSFSDSFFTLRRNIFDRSWNCDL